ncbi:hypothetical protein [Arthrobacter sp. D3-16]
MAHVQSFKARSFTQALFDAVKQNRLVAAACDGGGAFAPTQGQRTIDRFTGGLADRVRRETGQAVQNRLNVSTA